MSLQLLKSAHVLTHNKFWIRRHQPAAVSNTKEIFSFHFISIIKYNYNLTGIANTAPSSCIQIHIYKPTHEAHLSAQEGHLLKKCVSPFHPLTIYSPIKATIVILY